MFEKADKMITILIVEDDEDIRELITMILGTEDYAVAGLANGSAVLQTVAQLEPNLILMDVMLGDADGRDIFKTLKQQPSTASVPIIIVSATHGWHTAHEKRCGADLYLLKPFDVDELIGQVRRYVA